ncbi:hypothetical protein, partial [Sinomonas sp.]|uniref:hypothetical protein n=1 Tax=Sinomonas sp. TaxID=1914986 RepID=UPI002FDF0E4A
MKTHLLHPERSHFRPREKLQPLERDLAVDLELGPILDAMADGDDFVRAVSRTILLSAPCDPDVLVHRQRVLADFLSAPGLARDLYRLAVEALEADRHVYRSIFERYPDGIIRRSTQSLQLQFDRLRHLRAMADANSGAVRSPALRDFFDTIRAQLDEEFFDDAAAHLKHLKPYGTTLASARLAQGLKGADYTLRAPGPPEPWWRRLLAYLGLTVDPFTFRIPDRDEGGHRALSELKDRAMAGAANSLAQADDHIVAFFEDLRTEAAFYLGCLN